jgi:septal ring factor EnvC (AmiA/AmiB activator)
MISLIFFIAFTFPQSNEIDVKKKSLDDLRNEIKMLELDLAENQKREKLSYSNFVNLNKQKFYYEKIISTLRAEELAKSNQIEKLKVEIKSLENQIEKIKVQYSKFVVYNYKYGRISELEAILNSKSFRQALLRIKYLRDFSTHQQKEIKLLNLKIAELNSMQNSLEKEIEEKRLLTAEKNKEISLLNNKIQNEEKLLNELRKDRTVISKQISDKKKSEAAIKNLIEKLIAESQRPKLVAKKNDIVETNNNISKEQVFDNEFLTSSVSFNQLKGKLPFPVSRGRIISDFGNKRNLRLNTVSVNYGIDILCNEQTVRAVSYGIVSAIEWLPGYGTVVIITHNGNFRTVYGHLENIQVTENQRVNAGTVIGNVSNSLEGRVLHFQIWNGRQSVDPLSWLKN